MSAFESVATIQFSQNNQVYKRSGFFRTRALDIAYDEYSIPAIVIESEYITNNQDARYGQKVRKELSLSLK